METLAFDSPRFIRLRTDLETRLFLLHCLPFAPVKFWEHNFEIRVTWEDITNEDCDRIAATISKLKMETLQIKFN